MDSSAISADEDLVARPLYRRRQTPSASVRGDPRTGAGCSRPARSYRLSTPTDAAHQGTRASTPMPPRCLPDPVSAHGYAGAGDFAFTRRHHQGRHRGCPRRALRRPGAWKRSRCSRANDQVAAYGRRAARQPDTGSPDMTDEKSTPAAERTTRSSSRPRCRRPGRPGRGRRRGPGQPRPAGRPVRGHHGRRRPCTPTSRRARSPATTTSMACWWSTPTRPARSPSRS